MHFNFETLLIVLPGLILAITLHEAAHGYVASWLGDQTARTMGRLSLNPLRHVDPVGTLLVPGVLFLMNASILFGWAKPVPVDWRYLKQPKQDMAWIALAGPGINMLLAIISALLIYLAVLLPPDIQEYVVRMLATSVLLNCVIAIVNLIPLPPLDGGRILVGILPDSLAAPVARLEPYGFPILIGIIFVLPLGLQLIGIQFNPFSAILEPLITGLNNAILRLTGVVG